MNELMIAFERRQPAPYKAAPVYPIFDRACKSAAKTATNKMYDFYYNGKKLKGTQNSLEAGIMLGSAQFAAITAKRKIVRTIARIHRDARRHALDPPPP